GMSQEFLTRIFEPFVQADTDARSVYQGTGLGMSIAKALIEQMGGTLEVSSELNVGSRFVVTIPFELADESEVVKIEKDADVSIKGMHILLAEDNELNREIAETLLREEGAQVTSVVNGREAVDAVANNDPDTFDLVLMDVMMPVMDGHEATRQIRQMGRPDAETLPVVAMTANAFAEDIQKSFDAGMNGHITKPLEIDKMMRIIAKYRK
uniref:ATP-binding response regulator n=1 Tax=Frisingicoccus sp. TaxID=1918627 RepID=UPI0025C24467